MKKIIFIVIASVVLTGCIKWFGHPKPSPSPNALNLTNLKGKWTFYSDTVSAGSGNFGGAITHDYNDLAGYYYQFITDSTGLESLGTEPNSQFGFKYKLTNGSLILNYIDVANNPNFKLTTPTNIYVSEFSQHKMVLHTFTPVTGGGTSSETDLRLTR
ncbi:MAG TPA: hypothetical protein VFE54_02115 [Mucilaginibacter sp.]|jgi:hypothetical protein|nr:hypothetical protein [Mucilaginibacter sp.]